MLIAWFQEMVSADIDMSTRIKWWALKSVWINQILKYLETFNDDVKFKVNVNGSVI